MIMLSGAISRSAKASRSSATFLPVKSSPLDCAFDAGLVAADAALPACLRAVCCRPRAFPPVLAARVRAALLPPLRDEVLRDDELVLFARDDELPLLARDDELLLRLRDDVLLPRAPEPLLLLRADELLPRDVPPLDLRFGSAISTFLLRA
jgi:hypothetical protein